MSDGGKGDQRRPGKIPEGGWERIFGCKCPQGECRDAKNCLKRDVMEGKDGSD